MFYQVIGHYDDVDEGWTEKVLGGVMLSHPKDAITVPWQDMPEIIEINGVSYVKLN